MFARVTLVTLAVLFVLIPGHPSAQNPTLKTAMRAKLADMQRLLPAVITADYADIERFTEALSRISQTEVVSWQSAAQTEYLKQATLFVLSVQGLREAAARRNIDAALTEYTALVSSCTRCHAHVRSLRTISFERPVPR